MTSSDRKVGMFLFVCVLLLAVGLGLAIRKIHDKAVPFDVLLHELHAERMAKGAATAYWRDVVAQVRLERDGALVNLAIFSPQCREELRRLTGQVGTRGGVDHGGL